MYLIKYIIWQVNKHGIKGGRFSKKTKTSVLSIVSYVFMNPAITYLASILLNLQHWWEITFWCVCNYLSMIALSWCCLCSARVVKKAPCIRLINICKATKPALIQNRFSIKTGFALLSKLQNWICPKTGLYKTCLVSNTKIEASIRATKPKPWQSHLTSETVKIFIQNEKAGLVPMQSRFWCGSLSVGTKPVLVQQV